MQRITLKKNVFQLTASKTAIDEKSSNMTKSFPSLLKNTTLLLGWIVLAKLCSHSCSFSLPCCEAPQYNHFSSLQV